jgi:hypothetical protein
MRTFGWFRSLQCYFLPLWRIKMSLSGARENDFSGCRLILQTHLLHLASQICHLSGAEQSKFHVDDWPRTVIFCLSI